MDITLTSVQIITILRYLITAAGAGVWATKHDSELTNIAGLLVAIIPALIGAWKDYVNHKQQIVLKEEIVEAKIETKAAEVAVSEVTLPRNKFRGL